MKIEEMKEMPKIAVKGHMYEKGYVTEIRHTRENCYNDVYHFDPTAWTNLGALVPDSMEVTANFIGTPSKYEVQTAYKVMNRKGKVTLYVNVSEAPNRSEILTENTFKQCGHPFDLFFKDTIKLGSYQLTKDDFEMRSKYGNDWDDIILKRKFGVWLTEMVDYAQELIQAKMDDYMKQFSDTELKAIMAANACMEDLINAQNNINTVFDAVAGLVTARSSMRHIDLDKVSELEDMIKSTLDSAVRSIVYINKVEGLYNLVDEQGESHHHGLKADDVRDKLYKTIKDNTEHIKYDVEHMSLDAGFTGHDLHHCMSLTYYYAESFTGINLPKMHVKISYNKAGDSNEKNND